MLVLTTIGLSGCSEDKASTNNPLSGLDYQNSQHGFGLNYPDGWTVDENDQFGPVRFIGPIIDSMTVNYGVSDPATMEAGESLESLVIYLVEFYPTYFTNFVEISNNSRTINGMNAYDLIYTATQGEFDIKQMQVFIEKNSKTFTISFTASINSYDDYITLFEESMSSFTIV
jgi:hypothetical protein